MIFGGSFSKCCQVVLLRCLRYNRTQSKHSRLIFIKHIDARSIQRVLSYILAKYEVLYINAHTAPTHWDFKGFETPVLNWAIVFFFFYVVRKTLTLTLILSLSLWSEAGLDLKVWGLWYLCLPRYLSLTHTISNLSSFCLLTEFQTRLIRPVF